MDDTPKPAGFVSLTSMKRGAPDAAAALADIRRIYFKTTRKTIENDLAHAIALLKSLPTEEEREKATVFMEGLAQMRREWGIGASERTGSHGGTKKRRRTDKKKSQ